MRARVFALEGTYFLDIPDDEPKPRQPDATRATQPIRQTGATEVITARDEWIRELAKLTAAGMNRHEAARKLATAQPELRRRFVAEHNQQHGRKAARGRN